MSEDLGSKEQSLIITENYRDLNWKEMVKSKEFIYIALIFLNMMSFAIYLTLEYKNFGASSIKNDYFLATLGLIGTVLNAVFRFIWPNL